MKRKIYTYDKSHRKAYTLRLILRVFMTITGAVWSLYLLGAPIVFFTGFSFLFTTTYGFGAVGEYLMLFGLILSPILVLGVILLIAGSIYFKKTRGRYVWDDEKNFMKRTVQVLYIPVLGLIALFVLLYGLEYFLYSTYTGARVLVRFGMEDQVYNIRTPYWYVDDEEISYITLNDEPFSVSMPGQSIELPDFLDDLYYVKSNYEQELPDIHNEDGIDEYIFYDRDRLFIAAFYVTGDEIYFSRYGDISDGSYDYYMRLLKRN